MHQTTLERIEQELKKIKRQLQCGTQFFDTVEEFPEVGVPCAIYVDKSSGAFYVYDTATSTYITADAGEDVDFSLTTTGTSGAATLVGSTLNIPQYQSVLTNPVTGTGTAGQVSYWSGTGTQTGSANLFWDATNNRLGVGLNTGMTARLNVRGSGTTSATNALLVQNSSATELLKVTDDGFVRLGSAGAGMYASTSGAVNMSGPNVAFQSLEVNNPNYNFTFRNPNGPQLYTSGTAGIVSIGVGYAPTSGTGVFNQLNLAPTINQTGGANGITRGLYVNPTLTAAADWRSIEFSNNTGWGLYGAGTAPNYLAGRLAIGTTVASSSNLAITRPLTINGGSSIISDIAIGSAVTTVYGFRSRMFTTTGTYTVSDAYHFSADITTPDTSSGFANQYGFIAQSSMTGATNNYGFYGNIASGTGRWNLYMNGTADNYLAGSLGIGTTSLSSTILRISKGITGAASSQGLLVDGTVQADVTSTANFIIASPSTVSGTIGTVIGFRAQQGTFSGTVSNNYGFFAANNLIGASFNAGFLGDIPSGSGRWNLFMNGTAANYLAGNTSIGTTTSSGRLTVQGSGTTSATKALVVNNSTPTAIFEVLDNGRINQTIPGATANTIFGTNAGASASLSGSSNSFFGETAGQAVTTGGGNTLIGQAAGSILTTGGSNVYIGRSAGGANQTSTTNTGVGTFTMLNHTTGGNNITQGFNAARYYADGTTNAVSFSDCIYLGTATRVSGAGVTNEIAIGTSAIGNGSNTVTLGNTSITATYLRGSVSINAPTINASAKLQVDSTVSGFLPPRMTTAQRNLIASPAAGLVIFNTTTTKLECYDGAAWQAAW